MDSLELNGKTFYYDEIAAYSFRNSIPINGYEAKVLEFCRNWLSGQLEFVVRTSGSTGTPKDITLTREQLEISAWRTLTFLNLQKNDRILVCLNVEAIAGMMMVVRGFVGGLHLSILEPIANPIAFSKPEKTYDFISLVPYQLETILSERPAKKLILDFAKVILVGGGPVSLELEKKISNVKAPVYLTYGMTETVSHIALRRINGPAPEPHYTAFAGLQLDLDERGCLTVKGDVTLNKKIITNDLVNLHPNNTFTWKGRADNTINTGGFKVQLEKVEVQLAQALLALDINSRSFVSAVPDAKLGSKLIAIIESKALEPAMEKIVKEELAKNLTKYERPKDFFYLQPFISTASGKIDKIQSLKNI